MYSVLALLLLLAAFAVLVVTFLWIARLLGLIGQKPTAVEAEDEVDDEVDEETSAADDGHDPLQQHIPEDEDSQEEEEAAYGQAVILGANYGLVLGILACVLFMVSWLMLMLSAAAIGYSSRALYQGIRRYRLVVYRALIGFVLGMLSLGLQYLELTGMLGEMVLLLG